LAQFLRLIVGAVACDGAVLLKIKLRFGRVVDLLKAAWFGKI